VLEHTCLVNQKVVLVGNEHWALGWTITRYGEAALAQGTVAQTLSVATQTYLSPNRWFARARCLLEDLDHRRSRRHFCLARIPDVCLGRP
jgi:hypothetical protein